MIRAGELLRVVREPISSEEDWKANGNEEDEPIPTERVYYIRVGDGRECRWVNATFLAMPVRAIPSLGDINEAFKFSSPHAVIEEPPHV